MEAHLISLAECEIGNNADPKTPSFDLNLNTNCLFFFEDMKVC